MAKNINDPKSVSAFIQKLDPVFGRLIETIRQLILSTDPEIGEQIKWNAPAFFYMGTMKPFNAKEYKRDLVVVNIHKGYALLIFPTGAAIRDTTGLLEGDFKDGRRMVTFKTMDEVIAKGNNLQEIIRAWLHQVNH